MICELVTAPWMPQREANTCLRVASPFLPKPRVAHSKQEAAYLQFWLSLPERLSWWLECFKRQGQNVIVSIRSLPCVALAHETKELNAKLHMGSWDSVLHRC